jgi:hypothetical protein
LRSRRFLAFLVSLIGDAFSSLEDESSDEQISGGVTIISGGLTLFFLSILALLDWWFSISEMVLPWVPYWWLLVGSSTGADLLGVAFLLFYLLSIYTSEVFAGILGLGRLLDGVFSFLLAGVFS